MLIHITPRLFLSGALGGAAAQLVDLTVEEFGLVLKGGTDLATRQPYRNRRYLVGCKKVGQKAIDGILVETERAVRSYTTVARWAINAEEVITHHTHYIVLDEEFDTVSDSMCLWYATSASLGSWTSRWPECANGLIPASAQPRMDTAPAVLDGGQRQGDVIDKLSAAGLIVERAEIFRIPSIERGRLQCERAVRDRLPAIESAFKV